MSNSLLEGKKYVVLLFNGKLITKIEIELNCGQIHKAEFDI